MGVGWVPDLVPARSHGGGTWVAVAGWEGEAGQRAESLEGGREDSEEEGERALQQRKLLGADKAAQ